MAGGVKGVGAGYLGGGERGGGGGGRGKEGGDVDYGEGRLRCGWHCWEGGRRVRGGFGSWKEGVGEL